MWAYQARQEGDINFEANELLRVLDNSSNPEWWLAERLTRSEQGIFPAACKTKKRDPEIEKKENKKL